MTASATLVLANHRPETIPLAQRLMAAHDTILLEEPSDKRFAPMLDGKISIDAFLEDQEIEYPEFSRRMAQVLRERRQAGARLVQVEPFIDLLLSIHDRFANGEGPQDLPTGTDLYRGCIAPNTWRPRLCLTFTAHPAVTTSTPPSMPSNALLGPMPGDSPYVIKCGPRRW